MLVVTPPLLKKCRSEGSGWDGGRGGGWWLRFGLIGAGRLFFVIGNKQMRFFLHQHDPGSCIHGPRRGGPQLRSALRKTWPQKQALLLLSASAMLWRRKLSKFYHSYISYILETYRVHLQKTIPLRHILNNSKLAVEHSADTKIRIINLNKLK